MWDLQVLPSKTLYRLESNTQLPSFTDAAQAVSFSKSSSTLLSIRFHLLSEAALLSAACSVPLLEDAYMLRTRLARRDDSVAAV